jgi:hypothetical protein
MDKRSIVLVIILFALIVVGMLSYAYLKSQEVPVTDIAEELPAIPVPTPGVGEPVVSEPTVDENTGSGNSSDPDTPVSPEESNELPTEPPINSYGIEVITARHQFSNGAHTFSGEIELPTPCHQLSVDALVMESYPEQISLNFSVVNSSEMCAQVITSKPFSVTAAASAEAKVRARFMDEEVKLNLIK